MKNNSNRLANFKAGWSGSGNNIYPDLKSPEKQVRYFKEIVIPEEKNYNYAMTTLPYINPSRELEFDKPERDLKAYKEERVSTVGYLPLRFQGLCKYSE